MVVGGKACLAESRCFRGHAYCRRRSSNMVYPSPTCRSFLDSSVTSCCPRPGGVCRFRSSLLLSCVPPPALFGEILIQISGALVIHCWLDSSCVIVIFELLHVIFYEEHGRHALCYRQAAGWKGLWEVCTRLLTPCLTTAVTFYLLRRYKVFRRRLCCVRFGDYETTE